MNALGIFSPKPKVEGLVTQAPSVRPSGAGSQKFTDGCLSNLVQACILSQGICTSFDFSDQIQDGRLAAILVLKIAVFSCPELDLRSLWMDLFQTWYNYRTYLGAYACHLIFELRSKMAASRPYLFSKLPFFFLSGAGSRKFADRFISNLVQS